MEADLVHELSCSRCRRILALPSDLTAVPAKCVDCGEEILLPPELIQERQRLFELQMMDRAQRHEEESRRRLVERMAAAKRAAARRSRITVVLVFGLLLGIPILALLTLATLGIHFGKKATRWMEQVQDPKRNGMPAVLSELNKKQAEGCQRVLFGPEMRIGDSGALPFELADERSCVHLMGATGEPSAKLRLEHIGQPLPPQPLPEPAAAFDYRFCPNARQRHQFVISSDASVPYSVLAISCPRNRAEGLVRSTPEDPTTTGLGAARDWIGELRANGCMSDKTPPAAVQGPQVIEIDSTRGGPCFHLLAVSQFADVGLTVKLTSPSAKVLAAPAPAPRVHLEYCPSETGRHQIEIAPSTRDHFAVATLDCPRAGQNKKSGSDSRPIR